MRTRAPSRFFLLSVMGLCASVSSVVHAHFDLVEPKAADSSADGGKGAPPCGPTAASNVINKDQDGKPLQGGHPLRISLSETVMHPGHYRIAFAVNARSEIPADPAVVAQNGQSISATIQNPAVYPVLADGVFAHTSGKTPISFMTTITLPNVKCTKCTLQVIEFMAEHGANAGGGYFYHHCADLQYDPDPSLASDGGVGDAGSDGGVSGSGGRAAGSGGTNGSGGSNGSGGASSSGGVNGGTGGRSGSGGSSTGGSGTPGSGGANSGGATASGGSVGPATGGNSASGGSGGAGAPDAGTPTPADSSGCGCGIAQRPSGASAALVVVLCALALAMRRRARRSAPARVPRR